MRFQFSFTRIGLTPADYRAPWFAVAAVLPMRFQ